VGAKGVRERDGTNQNKAHPQREYIKTPFWMSAQILIMKIRTVK
jgi:hypothetical protein